MWPLLLFLLCLPPPGSGTPLRAPHSLALSENASNPGPQSPGASRMAPPVTPTLPPATSSDAPALSLNLGLNFKIKVRSQGKGRPGEGSGAATPRPGPSPTRAAASGHSKTPAGGFWPEAPGGSGAAEDPPSLGPGMWPWESILGSGPTARGPLALWPKLVEKGLDAEDDDDEDGRDKELEFKIDIDLTAGLGKEGGPNGSSNGGTGRRYPLLPGLSVGISEIASKLGAPGK
ncbi:hypothetical protein JD844_029147 [Phrynosoma platyrhinos]|uniref:Uncharacterized protein n=1 Tax=Phrynosoma platyrhinos TaxID=52577 RepID=A0ABQ7SIS8_PHRPL|nr:hypothetical protein JD844_029147 [Phrynosoma platyrhinos]